MNVCEVEGCDGISDTDAGGRCGKLFDFESMTSDSEGYYLCPRCWAAFVAENKRVAP